MSTGWPSVRGKCTDLGITFDGWQQGAGQVILAKRADGKYAATIGGVALSIPRQVGKTFLVGGIVFALCLLHPGLTVIWTAHRLRTAGETFDKMQGMARRAKIRPHVSKIVLGSGEEEVRFGNGSRIMFGARERGFGRGFDEVDVLIFDEAQILTENAIDDMVPAMNQSRQPAGGLMLFMGTPPKPTDAGEVFTRMRSEALSGEDEDTGYIEFSADPEFKPTPVPAPMQPEDWQQIGKANPSYPKRTPREAILRMRKKLTAESLPREAFGIWDDEDPLRVIGTATWMRRTDPTSLVVDRLALAVDVTPDRDKASITVAGARPDGGWHVEVVDNRPGVGWVVDRVAELHARHDVRAVVVDGASPAASLLEALQQAGVPVMKTDARQMAQACGGFYDATVEGSLWHLGQPVLNMALAAGRKRTLGDAWAWKRKDITTDITPLVGCTLALLGSRTEKPPKKKTGRATFV